MSPPPPPPFLGGTKPGHLSCLILPQSMNVLFQETVSQTACVKLNTLAERQLSSICEHAIIV